MDVRELRKEKGFSQMELAAKVGVSLTTIRNWEYQVSTPNEENMQQLKQVLKGGEQG